MIKAGRRRAVEYTVAFVTMPLVYATAASSALDFFGSYIDSYIYFRLGLLVPVLLFAVGLGNNMKRTKGTTIELQREADVANYAAAFKSQFLATMSHETRTPMNGVLGMIQMLKDSRLDQSQKQFIEIIDSSCKALLGVTNDILDISKLESGGIIQEQSTVKLEDLLDECICVFAAFNRTGRVEFNVIIDTETPAYFVGDFSRIRQVIINLLGNAFKFTDSGYVSITVSVDQRNEKSLRVFAISDTGTGIDPKTQSKLFSPFTQADESTSRKFGGMGLGLAICKELAEVMNGTIALESILGKGSTFSLQLPLNAMEQELTVDNTDISSVLRGINVLLVDDDATFLRTMDMTLTSWGMVVHSASNCEDAMIELQKYSIDNIIVDNSLRGGEGLGLVLDVRDWRQYQNFPIISTSAGFDIPTDEWLLTLGIKNHLIKPARFKALRSILTESLSSHDDIAKTSNEYHFEGLSVLVMEDNLTNQLVIKSMLSKLGVMPVVCDDGQQGFDSYLESLKSGGRPFDLIFMDCEMPVMNCYSSTASIREHEKTNKLAKVVPIIGLSAHAMKEHKDKALESGMNLYITKPVRLNDLQQAMVSLR